MILGVDRNADDRTIRTAYRKLSLLHHPDRQRSDEERLRANTMFAKISNAYEVLADPQQRREYDRQNDVHPYYHGFHDPFEVFRQVFREEFGGPSRGFGGFNRSSLFANDPFFANNSMMGASLFGDFFGGRDPFQDMMSSSRPPSNGFYYSSSSTSSFRGGGGGESVTTQTTTRQVNGRLETVTERITQRPDGTIHREVLNGNPGLAVGREDPAEALEWRDDANATIIPNRAAVTKNPKRHRTKER